MIRAPDPPADKTPGRALFGPAPASYSELCSRIERRKAASPRRLREVAAFILAHPDEIAFGPLAKLAKVARIPASAFVRLAQPIGYHGFSELQAVIRARLGAPYERSAKPPAEDGLSRCVRDVPLIVLTDGRMHRLASPAVPWFEVLEDVASGTRSHAPLECLVGAMIAEVRCIRRETPMHSALSSVRGPRSRPERNHPRQEPLKR